MRLLAAGNLSALRGAVFRSGAGGGCRLHRRGSNLRTGAGKFPLRVCHRLSVVRGERGFALHVRLCLRAWRARRSLWWSRTVLAGLSARRLREVFSGTTLAVSAGLPVLRVASAERLMPCVMVQAETRRGGSRSLRRTLLSSRPRPTLRPVPKGSRRKSLPLGGGLKTADFPRGQSVRPNEHDDQRLSASPSRGGFGKSEGWVYPTA